MDIKKIFHNLVSNCYMPEFDYMGHEFSFETINYTTAYSYCQCACAFEHEYCDYLSPSGIVNDEVYERVVQSVVNGQCPHVTEENEEYVRETGIYGIHLAAAVGTKEALTDPRYQFNSRFGRLFGLNPYLTAIYKENHEIILMPVLLHFAPKGTYRLLDARRSSDDPSRIIVESITILEFCVRRRNIRLLKSYIKLNGLDDGVSHALKIVFQHRLVEFEDVLLKDRTWFRYYDNLWTAGICCELAIIHDQSNVLERLLNYLYSVHYDTNNATDKLPQICHVLSREKCEKVLTKYGIHKNVNVNLRDKAIVSLNLLYKFYDDFKDEILKRLKDIPNVSDILNMVTGVRQHTCLHKYIDRKIRKPEVFKEMLCLGADINATDLDDRTPLMHLLKQSKFEQPDRQTLELIIFENPDENMHHSAVICALEQDVRLMTKSVHVGEKGNFLPDALLHSLFGYDGDESFALNFSAPLLIECGFPFQRDSARISMLLESGKGTYLHSTEYAYLQNQLNRPRSLLLTCRDRLRRHYKGRTIHAYIDNSNIPLSIKNFILLQPLLRCAPNCLLCS